MGASESRRPLLASPPFYYSIYVINAVVIVGLWWATTGWEASRSHGDLLNAAGRVTGLLGTYQILWQLVLMSRVPGLESAFGFERLAVLHRLNGYSAFLLIVAHAVYQTIGYQLLDSMSLTTQLADFVSAYEGMVGAIAGFLLLVLVVGVSIAISKRRLKYETWYFIHLYTYLAVALAFSHELAVGADFIANPGFAVYWWALYAVTFGCLIGFRVARPLLRFQRHRFRVQRVEKEAPGVFSVYVGGRRLSELGVDAGQFMLWRFVDGRRWWQAHPFSLSAVPDGRQLRLTVKSIGDFTARVRELKVGTPVVVEGPFGNFTEHHAARPKSLLIAGGVGITPLRAMTEEMAGRGVDACLLYRARSEQDIIFKAELDRLAAGPGVVVHYLLTGEGRAGHDHLSARSLLAMVPDLHDREVFVCGPPAMSLHALHSLAELQVPAAQIHAEAFRY